MFRTEPDYDMRFTALPNVVLSPHVGCGSKETRNAMGYRALDNIAAGAGRTRAIDPLWRDIDGQTVLLVTRRLPPAVEARAAAEFDARLTPSDVPISDVLARAAGADAVLTCPGDALRRTH